jgi:hypothetical protein
LARAIPIDASTQQIADAIVEQIGTAPPSDFSVPTWDESAASLVDVYREVLGRR